MNTGKDDKAAWLQNREPVTRASPAVLEAKLSAADRELPLSLASDKREERATAKPPLAFQLRLCPRLKASPPLGWVLGAENSAAMDNLIDGHEDIFKSGLENDELERAKLCQKNLVAALDDLMNALQAK